MFSSLAKPLIGVPVGLPANVGGGSEFEKFLLMTLIALEREGEIRLHYLPYSLENFAETLTEVDGQISVNGRSKVSPWSLNKSVYADQPPEAYTSRGIPKREKPQIGRVAVSEELQQSLKQRGIDALMCLSPGFTGPLSGLGYAAPVWDLMHKHFDYPEVSDNFEKDYRDFFYINMALSAKCIYAESEAGKEDILRHYGAYIGADRLKVVDILPFDFVKSTKIATLRPSQAVASLFGQEFFFYPAQYWVHKRHDTLIKAMAALRARGHTDVKLVFTGSYADFHRAQSYLATKDLVRTLGVETQIVFLGFVSRGDIDFLYRHALALLMPSDFGPSNLPPIEALLRSCPVVTSNAYGMDRYLDETVPKLNSSDVDAWADIMMRLKSDGTFRAELISKQIGNLASRSFEKTKVQVRSVIESLVA